MKKLKRTKKIATNSLFLIFIIFSLIFLSKEFQTGLKCPDDYKTIEESVEAMNRWTNNFFDNYPNATLEDWVNARYSFYEKNGCIEAIKRFNDVKTGKVDPEKLEVYRKMFREFKF